MAVTEIVQRHSPILTAVERAVFVFGGLGLAAMAARPRPIQRSTPWLWPAAPVWLGAALRAIALSRRRCLAMTRIC